MKTQSQKLFFSRLSDRKDIFPLHAQIELTYTCNLNCVHCYCKGLEKQEAGSRKQELTTEEWKRIFDEIEYQGCVSLCLSGGEPLIRDDFLEIYSYAKAKGFIITIFTNGLLFKEEVIRYLEKFPPYSIELTLNGISKNTYEAITRVRGSFQKAMRAVRLLAKKNLPLVLKANCLKQNKNEIVKIKRFTEKLLGRPAKHKYFFKYDPMVYPRLNGDKTPCDYRLSFEELLELKRQDEDIWWEYEKALCACLPHLERGREFLYQCNTGQRNFYINPYGRLKFCQFSDKFSVDLKTTSFKEGFYNRPSQILSQRFRTNSRCRDCDLRPSCYNCPARAYLETKDEEAPVPYFCELAKATAKERKIKLLNC